MQQALFLECASCQEIISVVSMNYVVNLLGVKDKTLPRFKLYMNFVKNNSNNNKKQGKPTTTKKKQNNSDYIFLCFIFCRRP